MNPNHDLGKEEEEVEGEMEDKDDDKYYLGHVCMHAVMGKNQI